MSTRTPLTQAELQHIEYCNKVLREHLELIQNITDAGKKIFDVYGSGLNEYIGHIYKVQVDFGRVVLEITKSAKELRGITGGTQELINYTQAATKLNEVLDDKLIQKIVKVTR